MAYFVGAGLDGSIDARMVAVTTFEHLADEGLLYIRFENTSAPRSLALSFE